MILTTYNTVVEAVMYKGNSSSENLFELIFCLRQVELKISTKLLVSHVT